MMNANTLCAECGHEKHYHLQSDGRGNRNVVSNCDFVMLIGREYQGQCPCKAFRPANHSEELRGMVPLPVTYDSDPNPYIRDAKGRVVAEIAHWQFNWPAQGGKPDDEITPENGHAIGQQIATALNDHDRLVAEVEELKKLVGKYETILDHTSSMSTTFGEMEQHVGDRWSAEGEDGWFNTALEAFQALSAKEDETKL